MAMTLNWPRWALRDAVPVAAAGCTNLTIGRQDSRRVPKTVVTYPPLLKELGAAELQESTAAGSRRSRPDGCGDVAGAKRGHSHYSRCRVASKAVDRPQRTENVLVISSWRIAPADVTARSTCSAGARNGRLTVYTNCSAPLGTGDRAREFDSGSSSPLTRTACLQLPRRRGRGRRCRRFNWPLAEAKNPSAWPVRLDRGRRSCG